MTIELAGRSLLVRKLRRHTIRNRVAPLLVAALLAGCAHAATVRPPKPPVAPAVVFGIPLYPGARGDEGGAFTMRLNDGVVEVAAFQTSDAFDRVRAFYRRRLPIGSQTVSAATADGSAASFEFRSRGGRVTVEVASSKPRETDILLKRFLANRRAETSTKAS